MKNWSDLGSWLSKILNLNSDASPSETQDALQNELTSKDTTIATLQKDLESAQADLATAQTATSDSQATISDLTAQLAAANAQVSALSTENENLKKKAIAAPIAGDPITALDDPSKPKSINAEIGSFIRR
jgi:chromosome segregation ATPase